MILIFDDGGSRNMSLTQIAVEIAVGPDELPVITAPALARLTRAAEKYEEHRCDITDTEVSIGGDNLVTITVSYDVSSKYDGEELFSVTRHFQQLNMVH